MPSESSPRAATVRGLAASDAPLRVAARSRSRLYAVLGRRVRGLAAGVAPLRVAARSRSRLYAVLERRVRGLAAGDDSLGLGAMDPDAHISQSNPSSISTTSNGATRARATSLAYVATGRGRRTRAAARRFIPPDSFAAPLVASLIPMHPISPSPKDP